jgi:HIRAN domain
MGQFDWLFGPRLTSVPKPIRKKRVYREAPGRDSRGKFKTFKLVEGNFDPDGDETDFEWYGFHIHDENKHVLSYAEAENLGLGIKIFRVAGVDFRADELQREEFAPGEVLKLIPETDDKYDRNAVGVWDRSGRFMVGYVPKEVNPWIRAAMTVPQHAAISLAEHRKDGKRVSLTVMFGPMSIS